MEKHLKLILAVIMATGFVQSSQIFKIYSPQPLFCSTLLLPGICRIIETLLWHTNVAYIHQAKSLRLNVN